MSRTKTRTRPKKPTQPKTTTTAAPLPTRPPVTDADANAASATLYAGSLRIHAPYPTWTGQPNDSAHTVLDDDTRLHYTRNPSSIEAAHLCTHGIWHTALITDGHELPPFAQNADDCTLHTPIPLPERALTLGTSLHRATAAADETQQLSRDDIDAGLTATTEDPKEHSQS